MIHDQVSIDNKIEEGVAICCEIDQVAIANAVKKSTAGLLTVFFCTMGNPPIVTAVSVLLMHLG